MQRFLLKLAYDGSQFKGWQIQKRQRTVQRVIEKALKDFTGTKTRITGSGRTDTGVHALAQYAHFDYKGTATPLQMQKGIRRFLPDDVQIIQIYKVSDDFHARYDAYQRCYQYLISKTQTPFNRLYQASFPRKRLNPELIIAAAPFFLGEHDFSSFSKDNPAVPDHVCNVNYSVFEEHDEYYAYTIRANRFLHNMVRRIVGAMLNISHLELDPKIILYWLEQKDAMQTIIYPAPPQGLYLQEVSYPKEKLDLNQ